MEFTSFQNSSFRSQPKKKELILIILNTEHTIYTLEELSELGIKELTDIINSLFIDIHKKQKPAVISSDQPNYN